MLAGYFEYGMHEKPACFDLFFRNNPYRGGYAVFAGLDPALRYLADLRFSAKIWLICRVSDSSAVAFSTICKTFVFAAGSLPRRRERAVFANEPLVTVEGSLAEAQFVETALLTIINFQTLIATKAARIQHAAGNGEVIEFGLRRAQGPDGGLGATRAAFVGGVSSTSNTWAGQLYGLPVKGTHAHSWVMAFADELSAFRAYARFFPTPPFCWWIPTIP